MFLVLLPKPKPTRERERERERKSLEHPTQQQNSLQLKKNAFLLWF